MRMARLALHGVQVALVAVVVGRFQLEGRGFFMLSLLAAIGFVIHSLLAQRWRLPFFALLSIAGIGLVAGAGAAAWIIGLGLLLITLCHLPVPFRIRIALLVLCAAGLVALRADWIPAPWPEAVWPILGSMFMFRLLVYLYDLRHGASHSRWHTLSYFFMLPNPCFVLFPVVDFKSFRQARDSEAAHRATQSGLDWMTRGIIHLIAYRLIYHHGTLLPEEVTSSVDVLRFLVANFGLYLRVSGTFHLAVGTLRLFHFELPLTHDRYFLAAGIPDFWRRINIYWKDFMVKLVFQPLFFRLRGHGFGGALAVATAGVFVATWLLHSYQWFWIAGDYPVTWQDATFWGTLGILMVAASVIASRRQPGRRSDTRRLGSVMRHGLWTFLTFSFVCVLWSLWTTGSLGEWLSLWQVVRHEVVSGAWPSLGVTALLLMALWAVLTLLRARLEAERARPGAGSQRPQWRSAATNVLVLAGLLALSVPAVCLHLGARIGGVAHSLRQTSLSRVDVARLQRGYYESMFNTHRLESPMWHVHATRPASWQKSILTTAAARPTGDFLSYELVPGSAVVFRGAPLHVNRWGMRDRDYQLDKPPGTFRIAMVGASLAMGSGVADGETFESLLEERLNRLHGGTSIERFEILNFAVDAYSPLQRLITVERKVLRFDPDVLLYTGHGTEGLLTRRQLGHRVRQGIEPHHLFVRRLLSQAGVKVGEPASLGEDRLAECSAQIIPWVYHRIVGQCRQGGIATVWVHVPTLANYRRDNLARRYMAMAQRAGFVVIDLVGALDGHDISTLSLAEWDFHPNPAAHALFADRLYAELAQRPDIVALGEPISSQSRDDD